MIYRPQRCILQRNQRQGHGAHLSSSITGWNYGSGTGRCCSNYARTVKDSGLDSHAVVKAGTICGRGSTMHEIDTAIDDSIRVRLRAAPQASACSTAPPVVVLYFSYHRRRGIDPPRRNVHRVGHCYRYVPIYAATVVVPRLVLFKQPNGGGGVAPA